MDGAATASADAEGVYREVLRRCVPRWDGARRAALPLFSAAAAALAPHLDDADRLEGSRVVVELPLETRREVGRCVAALREHLEVMDSTLAEMFSLQDTAHELAGARSTLMHVLTAEREAAEAANTETDAHAAMNKRVRAVHPRSVRGGGGADVLQVLQCLHALVAMYESELLLKQRIVAALPTAQHSNEVNTYMMVWDVEAHVDRERLQVMEQCVCGPDAVAGASSPKAEGSSRNLSPSPLPQPFSPSAARLSLSPSHLSHSSSDRIMGKSPHTAASSPDAGRSPFRPYARSPRVPHSPLDRLERARAEGSRDASAAKPFTFAANSAASPFSPSLLL